MGVRKRAAYQGAQRRGAETRGRAWQAFVAWPVRCRVQGFGVRAQGLAFRVQGSGFRVWGLVFRDMIQG